MNKTGVSILFHYSQFPHSPKELATPWHRAASSKEENEKAKKAYDSVLIVTMKRPTGPDFEDFSSKVRLRGGYSCCEKLRKTGGRNECVFEDLG